MKRIFTFRVRTTAASRPRMVPLAIVALALLALAAFPAPAQSGVIYVDWAASSETRDGMTWDTAYHYLSQALSEATAGDQIWVAWGLYYPDEGPGRTAGDRSSSFLLVDGVSVYGGFAPQDEAGTWETRDPGLFVTVLSGDLAGDDTTDGDGVVLDWEDIVGADNAYHVVLVPAAATVVLDGFTVTAGSADDDPGRGGGLKSGSGSHSTLDHMVFQGNKATPSAGGGAFFDHSTQAVANTQFIGNLSHWGGGVYSWFGSSTFLDVVFEANDAATGGGLVTDTSVVSLEDAQFNGNTASFAGGMLAHEPVTLTNVSFDGNSNSGLVDYGCSTLTDVTFTNNTGSAGGGAQAQCSSAPAIYTRVSFEGNTAVLGGGLWYHATEANNILDVVDGVFIGNHAPTTDGRGGAIYIHYGRPSSLHLTNTLIRGNRADCADDGGGAIFGLYGCATLINSTVTGNSRSALWWMGTSGECNWIIRNSIVWGNTGVPVNGGPGSEFSHSIMQNYHDYNSSLEPDAPCHYWATCDANTSFTTNPLFVTSVDPTTAPTTLGDVHLQATSPAIDAGNNDFLPADVADLDGDGNTSEPLPVDLDFNARRTDGPVADTGSGTAPIVDMGAYEYTAAGSAWMGLESSANPSHTGDTITLTATVWDPSYTNTPTGTVTFRDDDTVITGCADVELSGGEATCDTSELTAGTHTLHAYYSGDALFRSTVSADLEQEVIESGDTPQTITFDNPGAQAFGTTPTLTASASSLLPVTFSSSTTGVCTVTSGGTLTFVTVGTCTIDADQAGDETYAPADTVTRSFEVTPGAQTITFDNPGAQAFGTTPTLTASASSGLDVTFTSSTTDVCTVTAGGALTFVTVGTCTIDADQAGNATWAAAVTVARSFEVTPRSQTITFDSPGAQDFGTTPTLTASASSGLAVTFGSSTTGVCTVTSGGELTFVTVGTCTIDADQAGDTTWAAAETVTRSFTVEQGTQTIDFGTLADKTYGDADFAVSATASSGLDVTFGATGTCSVDSSGSSWTVTIAGAGSCTITASQAGDDDWQAATPVEQSFDIDKADASCSITGWTGSYDGSAHGASGSCTGVLGQVFSAPASTAPGTTTTTAKGVPTVSALKIDGASLSLGDSFTDVPGGTAHWEFDGATNYNSQNGDVSVTVNARPITITADNQTKTAGQTFTFAGTEFDITSGSMASGESISSVTLASDGAAAGASIGPYDIVASDAVFGVGSAGNYDISYAKGTMTVVAAATLTVTAHNLNVQYSDPNPVFTFGYSGWAGGDGPSDLTAEPSCGTSRTPLSAPGTYDIVCSGGVDDVYSFSYVKGTLTVLAEDVVVTASAPAAVGVDSAGGTAGNGTPITVTAAIEEVNDGSKADVCTTPPQPVGVTITLTPVGSGSPLSHAASSVSCSGGVYTVSADFSGVPVNVYEVSAAVSGSYYTGSDATVLGVFDPSLGFASGGGQLVNPNSGNRANFGFTVKYQKKGKALGELLYIEHAPGRPRSLKSHAIDSLSLVDNEAIVLTRNAVFDGVGGYGVRLIAIDNGEGGQTADELGLQVTEPSGAAVSDFSFDPVTLSGGNIQVPHETKGGGGKSKRR